MNNPNTAIPSNPAIPTAAQLADARLKQWHQQGEALLTLENLRSFVNAVGLVLYAPRPQIASPAPSMLEAVLGTSNPSPTLEQSSEARGLFARLVAEGLAVPLNLLGAAGETPDFVASAAVFSYVFTLRGDKAWKQPPATAGALKVSNLAQAAYEALVRRGTLTAYALATELGKEVTEAAVLRALGELWAHLRVLPLPQPDGRPAVWELTSARFTKQIKAGANAGQPSALSALISLYLGQAIVAAEEEIESFLSPLTARSRVREVVHALLAARQLDTLAVEGRTVLHVAGELPAFLAPEPMPASEAQAIEVSEIATEAPAADVADSGDGSGEAPRITKYVPKPRKVGTGDLAKAKPAKLRPKPFAGKPDAVRFGAKAGFKPGPKPGFQPRPGLAPDRERRPFRKPAESAGPRGFDKPWDEEKARRPSAPRGKEATGDTRPPRKSFSKPGTFGRKREGFGGKSSFGSESRPPRAKGSDFAPRKPFGAWPAGGVFAIRAGFSKDRPATAPREGQERGPSAEGGKRVYRKFDAPRGDRPGRPFSPDRSARSNDRKTDGRGPKGEGRNPAAGFVPRKFSGKPSGKPGGFSGKTGRKPGGGFGAKGPFAKAGRGGFAGKISGTFAKFAGNKKPFGKKAPPRKFKPKEGE